MSEQLSIAARNVLGACFEQAAKTARAHDDDPTITIPGPATVCEDQLGAIDVQIVADAVDELIEANVPLLLSNHRKGKRWITVHPEYAIRAFAQQDRDENDSHTH